MKACTVWPIRLTKAGKGSDLIGTKAEAEKVVQEITDRKVVAFDRALKRNDG